MSDTLLRSLWVNVIKTAIEDAIAPVTNSKSDTMRRRRLDRSQARAWFRRKTPDFIEVCSLAGFDPDDVLEKAAKAIQRCDELEATGKRFAIEKPKDDQPKRKVQTYTHDGLTFTVAQWAKHLGIPNQRIHYRLAKGMTIADALNPKPLPRSSGKHLKPRKARLVTVNGVSKSLTVWSQALGMSYAALMQRRKRYTTHEASIAAALQKRQADTLQ